MLAALTLATAGLAAHPVGATVSPSASAAPSTPAAAVDTVDTARTTLLEMRAAFQKGDASRLAALLPRIAGDPLEPLAAYWTLRARLERASAEEVQAFFARWRDTYWEDRLRKDWLLVLGQQQAWEALLQEAAAFRMNDDAEVRCYTALARWATGRASAADIAPEVRQAWLTQRQAMPGCAAAAQQLIEAGALPRDVAWQRARLGVEAGRLAIATQAVGLLDPDWVPLVERAYAAPQRYLNDKLTAVRHRTKEIVTLALIRLATVNPAEAAAEAAHLRWRAQLTDEERAWVWGAIGKRAALRRSDAALTYFARAADAPLPDDWRVWQARAALRAGDWATVRRAIEALDEGRRREPVWTYWLARALAASGRADDAATARALYERIAGSGGFYEQLAAEALGQPLALPPAPPPPTAAERAAVRANAGLQRALRAIDIGLRSEGVREWHYEVALHRPGGLGERELLAAAEWACERGVWDRCINTSARTRDAVHIGQRYPTPLRELLTKHAQANGLDPAYVYGLIRQESRFVMDARSRVGASGLMQVMPATARWTARKIGLAGFAPDQITDPDTNVRIGTAYLKLVLDDFEGSMALAAAAYNAGPGRARQWREGPTLEAAVWIENIPLDETREYVKQVLANTTVYAAILSGEPQGLSVRLGRIGPRLATARAPDTELP